MNMIDATVGKDGALTTLSFGGHTVALSARPSQEVRGCRIHIGKVVTLGIRPEDLHDEESTWPCLQRAYLRPLSAYTRC